jgi:hypothetical protein
MAGQAHRVPCGPTVLTPRRAGAPLLTAMATLLAVTGGAPGAFAEPPPPITVAPRGHGDSVNIIVRDVGRSGSPGSETRRILARLRAIDSTAIHSNALPQLSCMGGAMPGCAATTAAPGPSPTAAQLAQQAFGLLRLPSPTGDRSPDEGLRWRGEPFTYVNLWTWFWTSPESYQQVSKSVTAGAVSATVTAVPTELVFDPGDNHAPVSCLGPGRAWRESDGAGEPSTGCGYQYRHVTAASAVIASVSIRWRVSWVGNNGESGTLPMLVTQRSTPLKVLQVQVVNAGEART